MRSLTRTSPASVALYLLLLAGCRKPDGAPADAAPATSSSQAARAGADDAMVALAHASTPADTLAAGQSLVTAWSRALDQHDVAVLATMYAKQVGFYGRSVSRADVLAMKTKALGPTSTFRQSIEGPIVADLVADGVRATFTKRSGSRGKLHDVKATLLLKNVDGALLISDESDDATQKHLKDEHEASCARVAASVVEALPVVKREMEAVARAVAASDGGAREGGVGPLDRDEGGFSVGLGIHTDERFEAHVWYDVDVAGKLTVTVLADDVSLPEASTKRVLAACRP